MMENIFLKRLIEELKDLNDTPKFQLERAISPLLGIFIKEIIDKRFNTNVSNPIPEFPLKKRENKQSTNIDWLLADYKNKVLYFIELKTDTHSYSEDQSKIYKNIKGRIEKAKSASLLKSELDSIIPKSRRKEKYISIFNKLIDNNIRLSDYQKLKIIFLAPAPPKGSMKIFFDDLVLFKDLPNNISQDFNAEWLQLKTFLLGLELGLKKKRKVLPQDQQEGNLAVFKDLGIYSEDPEEDEKINQNLIKFLESKGYKMPEIKIIKSGDKSGA